MVDVLDRVENRIELAAAELAIKVGGKPLEVDIGRVHVSIERRARLGLHVARGDRDRFQAARVACFGGVYRVLHENGGIVVREGHGAASAP